MNKINSCASAVVFAGGVNGCGVEAAPVLSDRLVGQRAGRTTPMVQRPAEIKIWVGPDEALRKRAWLDQEKEAPDVRRSLLIDGGVHRPRRYDVENGKARHLVCMV